MVRPGGWSTIALTSEYWLAIVVLPFLCLAILVEPSRDIVLLGTFPSHILSLDRPASQPASEDTSWFVGPCPTSSQARFHREEWEGEIGNRFGPLKSSSAAPCS